MSGTQNRPMRRFDRELSREETQTVIDAAPFAVVSTVDDEGHVYGVPVNPVCVGEAVYFHTTSGASRRNDNIRAHQEICLTFVSEAQVTEHDYSCNYACAVVEGSCEEVTDIEEKRQALAAIIARWAPSNDEERNARYIDKHFEGCAIWRVSMTKVSGKARRAKPHA